MARTPSKSSGPKRVAPVVGVTRRHPDSLDHHHASKRCRMYVHCMHVCMYVHTVLVHTYPPCQLCTGAIPACLPTVAWCLGLEGWIGSNLTSSVHHTYIHRTSRTYFHLTVTAAAAVCGRGMFRRLCLAESGIDSAPSHPNYPTPGRQQYGIHMLSCCFPCPS